MALAPDTVLQSRYRILRHLGEGGMGTVYEAKALRLNTTVALKETHFTDERLRRQFEHEAQLLAGLRHSALPRVIDHFSEGESLCLVMDFIQGDDLWERLRKRGEAFPVSEVLRWGDELLDALNYLHSQDPPVIHRDIKPQNLKLTGKNEIILLDFGLAKGFTGPLSRITTSGSIFGYTPNYAPLEQVQGTGTDPRSDLYSLGATLYHLITGVAPPDVITRVTATTDEQHDPLRPANEINRDVTPAIASVLNKALSLGRTQRFSAAFEMRDALRVASQFSTDPESELTKSFLPVPGVTKASSNIPGEILPTLASPDQPRLPPHSEVTLVRARGIKTWIALIGAIVGLLVLLYGAETYFSLRKPDGGLPANSLQTSNSTGTDQNEKPLQGVRATRNSNAMAKGVKDELSAPPAKPTPHAPISGGVLNTKAINLVHPQYPPLARTAHVSGQVSVQVLIDENGNVIAAHASSGNPLLQAAAVAAARASKFAPTKISGQPVKVSGLIIYNFVPQ